MTDGARVPINTSLGVQWDVGRRVSPSIVLNARSNQLKIRFTEGLCGLWGIWCKQSQALEETVGGFMFRDKSCLAAPLRAWKECCRIHLCTYSPWKWVAMPVYTDISLEMEVIAILWNYQYSELISPEGTELPAVGRFQAQTMKPEGILGISGLL